MSLGVGVGDILAVSKLARSVWSQVRNASDHFNAISNEVAGLHLVLDDVAQNFSRRQLSEKQKHDLSSLTEGTRSVLEEMALVLQKFTSLGKEQPTISTKTQKAWKKLCWDQDAIQDFRSRIIANTTILNTFNSSVASKTSQTVVEDVAKLGEQMGGLKLNDDRRERQALLDWITPLNFPSQQNAVFNRRQEGTGQWLFESSEFKAWMSMPGKTLVCRGMPGAGKTILASTVIDHLLRTLDGGKISVAYIYCDYKKQHEQTSVTLIASIMKQLLQRQFLIPQDVRKSYQHHTNSGTRPTADELFALLQSTLSGFSHVYIVVDAVDELLVGGQVPKTLLSSLNSLGEVHTVNLMMTSRFIPHITQELRDPLYLEIRASDEDVRKYVRGHINGLAKCVLKIPELQETIEESIVNAVDGMFLLAQLHMDSLIDKTSPKAIKKCLENLPKGSDALDIAYEQAMQRIEDQKPGFRDLAKRTLAWITYTYELLTVMEVRHALAIEVGESRFDKENLDEIDDIVSACCGLVTIDPETEAVRLVHYTTQVYFKRTGSRYFPNAQHDFAACCLTYLLFDDFGEGWIWDDIEGNNAMGRSIRYRTMVPMEARLLKYPFLRYAARFWARHAEDHTANFEGRVGKLLVDFLTDDFKVSSAGQFVLRKRKLYPNANSDSEFGPPSGLYFESGVPSPTPMSGLHLATYFNLSGMMSYLLETRLFSADVKDQAGRTPLIWAAHEGHECALKVLLHRQDVDVKTIDTSDDKDWWYSRTALTCAARYGHIGTMKLLLEREIIDVNVRDKDLGKFSLIWAVTEREEATVELLLKHKDIETDQLYSTGQTALSTGAAYGCPGIVQLFIEGSDGNVNNKDERGWTPLTRASKNLHVEVVKLLLQHPDVDVNSKDKDGTTVLEHALKSAEAPHVTVNERQVPELLRRAIQARAETNGTQPLLHD